MRRFGCASAYGCLALLTFLGAGRTWADVVLNEIHYNPPQADPLEFVELHNAGERRVDVSGWSFSSGIGFTFPPGAGIAPHGFLVVAQNPDAVRAAYGVEAIGPWNGRLDNDGERLTLQNSAGEVVDTVGYGAGFPWPTAAAGGGASMELLHPRLDNDLGGSWRSSVRFSRGRHEVFVPSGDGEWAWRKGTSEPSSPSGAWRQLSFRLDSTWQRGTAPFGYGDGDDRTVLRDMPGRYTSVYMRRTFKLAEGAIPDTLLLRIYSDDGAVVWINGVEVARLRVSAGPQRFDSSTIRNHEARWESLLVENAIAFLRSGTNVLAVHGLNGSLASSDFSIDAELSTPPSSAIPPRPTPGRRNSAFSESVPPQVRQVAHVPELPKSGEAVHIRAKVTDSDGVESVQLLYQIVEPGDYIRRNDPRYTTHWKRLTLVDDGKGADATAGDGIFTAQLPGSVQRHRRLVRYRIQATDRKSAAVTVPYADDEQSNFAYFTYDGAPTWRGADRPGETPAKMFSASLMNSLPIIHLIANPQDVENSQFNWSFNEQFLRGTLIYGTRVYDHVRFRNRGETTTYMTGKNKWRFNFLRGHELRATDDYGRLGERPWRRLSLNPGTVPYDSNLRGNAALQERLAFRLHQLAGLPASDTKYVHFRVIDDPSEEGPDQYSGDFWGLYLQIQPIDGRFLSNQGEPDGELFKIAQGGILSKRTLGDAAGANGDFSAFWRSAARRQSEEWWRATVDLERYYSYHAISIASGRWDQKENHNYVLYRNPERGWLPLPWDTDMCMRTSRYRPEGYRWQTRLKYSLRNPALHTEYQNRARELLDVLFTRDQMDALVEELSSGLRTVGNGNFAELDQFQWNHHPRATSGHRGRYFLDPVRSRATGTLVRFGKPGIEGRIAYFKSYLAPPLNSSASSLDGFQRRTSTHGGWGYRQLQVDAIDPNIPKRPTVRRNGRELTFRVSPFTDPQGSGSFAGLQWRLGEIYNPTVAGYAAGEPYRYEVTTLWQLHSDSATRRTATVPAEKIIAGRTYRVRARYSDDSGRWGHWSVPVEFVAPR